MSCTSRPRRPLHTMEGTTTWAASSSSATARSAGRSRRPRATAATTHACSGVRPTGGIARSDLHGADLVVEASRGDAVASNLAAALDAGCRRFVIATTGWTADRPTVEALLREHGAAAVAASNFSLGVVLFGRLVEAAVGLFGPLDGFDPYLLEWHRRSKRDRPSGTATDLARRIADAHPRLDGRRRPRGRLDPRRRLARDAPGRVRCRRRDGRTPADRPRPLRLRGRDPRRRRLAPTARRASPASTPSTPSSTSSSLATPSLPERTDR